MSKRKQNSLVYVILGIAAASLLAVLAILFVLPRPLSMTEKSLLGTWTAASPDYEKELTFHKNRVVDVTNPGVRNLVFRWRVAGEDLMIKEGKGRWDRLNKLRIIGNRFSVGEGDNKLEFVRVQPGP